MSNLQNNIASLEALITKANALPEEKTIQSSKTVTPTTSSQTVKPDSGYDGMGQVVVNAMPTATQATPSVSIDSAGKITATATQSAGYVAAGTKTGTKQLTTQAAKTITPTKSSQTAVAKNVYTTGAVTVAAIPAQYITTTDASAAADDIVTGETAYVNGVKVTGTNPYEKAATDAEIEAQETLLADIAELLGAKSVPSTLQIKAVNPSTEDQIIVPDEGYEGFSQVTVNAVKTATQATPSISVSSDGLITSSATQSAGYVSAGTKSSAEQLTVQEAQMIIPSAIDQVIDSGKYLIGTQIIKGDENLIPENIKSGVSIFGVTGSNEGGSKPTVCMVNLTNWTYDAYVIYNQYADPLYVVNCDYTNSDKIFYGVVANAAFVVMTASSFVPIPTVTAGSLVEYGPNVGGYGYYFIVQPDGSATCEITMSSNVGGYE